ncbi:hypothetical protein FOZ63_012879, partial [Perkinsus olseni]
MPHPRDILQALCQWKATQPPSGSAGEVSENQRLQQASLRPSTQRQYAVSIKYYLTITTFPATADRLQTYMRCLRDLGFPAKTIRKYISAIRSEHSLRGFAKLSATDEDSVRRALHGIDRTATRNGSPKQATPIPHAALQALIALHAIPQSTTASLRGIALCTTGLVARLCEVISLKADHISALDTTDP